MLTSNIKTFIYQNDKEMASVSIEQIFSISSKPTLATSSSLIIFKGLGVEAWASKMIIYENNMMTKTYSYFQHKNLYISIMTRKWLAWALNYFFFISSKPMLATSSSSIIFKGLGIEVWASMRIIYENNMTTKTYSYF